MGYSYAVRVRIVPADGPDVIYDLTQLTECKGPVALEAGYNRETRRVTDPNGRLRERAQGLRGYARMTFQIGTISEEAWLADIVSLSVRPGTRIYLSMDGGTTELEAVCDGDYARNPLGGKTVGVEATLSFLAVERVDTARPLVEGVL